MHAPTLYQQQKFDKYSDSDENDLFLETEMNLQQLETCDFNIEFVSTSFKEWKNGFYREMKIFHHIRLNELSRGD